MENIPRLKRIGFQKLRIGRGSVLTKYEPVASRLDPVLKFFCWYGETLFAEIMYTK